MSIGDESAILPRVHLFLGGYMYPFLALLSVLAVPISLFVGLWSGSVVVALLLPFVMLILAAYLGAKAQEAASRDF